jgi:hypothetical protein
MPGDRSVFNTRLTRDQRGEAAAAMASQSLAKGFSESEIDNRCSERLP